MGLRRLAPLLAGMLTFVCWGNALAQFSSGKVTLQWTVPGDDSMIGNAARYDLRYSLFPINGRSFAFANSVSGLPLPARPGSIQRFTVYGLLPGLRYYFALKTADENLNWSPISNVCSVAEQTAGVIADPSAISFGTPIPNPAVSNTGFVFSLPRPEHVSLRIFDVQGRMVSWLIESDQPAGAQVVIWNLRDMVDRPVQPGVYLARAVIGQESFVRRVVVTH